MLNKTSIQAKRCRNDEDDDGAVIIKNQQRVNRRTDQVIRAGCFYYCCRRIQGCWRIKPWPKEKEQPWFRADGCMDASSHKGNRFCRKLGHRVSFIHYSQWKDSSSWAHTRVYVYLLLLIIMLHIMQVLSLTAREFSWTDICHSWESSHR